MMDRSGQANNFGQRNPGSLADMVVAAEPAGRLRFTAATWVKIAVLAGLFTLMNFWQFRILFNKWLHDTNWGHGFIIPLFSLYLLFARRAELLAARRRTCLWGLGIMVLALILQILAYYPIKTHWFCQLSMTLILFGMVLYLGGPEIIKLTWLPIFYLVLAMPIPDMLYSRIAVPLQELAAWGSTVALRLVGVEMEVTASHISILSISGTWHGLTVAEACSGIRSLIAYVALGVAWAYLEDRPIWQRAVLVASTVPIALLCNVIRVTGTSTMYVMDRPELGQDFMHEFMGMIMLVPALVMLWLLGKLLQSLFIEVDEHDRHDGRETSEEKPKS